jgi:peroxiredoxin
MRKLLFSALALAVTVALVALTPSGVAPGDQAPAFNLKNVDGQMVSFNTYPDAKGFIVVFTCNHCPAAIASEPDLLALDAEFRPKGYPVIAINSNDPTSYPDDSYANMQTRARERGFTFPYVFDETQEIARAYGATKTPHVFIVQRENGKLVVKYTGAIAEKAFSSGNRGKAFTHKALEQLLAGQRIDPATTAAVGCGIKWRQQ